MLLKEKAALQFEILQWRTLVLEILLHNMRELVVSAYVFRVTGTSTTVADQCVQVRGLCMTAANFHRN